MRGLEELEGLEGLEGPGFCSHLGVRMAAGRNGLRATAATPSGKPPSGRCPRAFRLLPLFRLRRTLPPRCSLSLALSQEMESPVLRGRVLVLEEEEEEKEGQGRKEMKLG